MTVDIAGHRLGLHMHTVDEPHTPACDPDNPYRRSALVGAVMVIDPAAQHRARLDDRQRTIALLVAGFAKHGVHYEVPNLPVRTHVMTHEISTQVLRWWLRYWRTRLDGARSKGERTVAMGAVSTLVDQLTMRVRH